MIYTIGHSTLSIKDFVDALMGIPVVIDIRSHPSSRIEHFNHEDLETWLPQFSKKYIWEPRMGGWVRKHANNIELRRQMDLLGVDLASYEGKFPKQRIALKREAANPGIKPEWTNLGLYDYSYYMMQDEFLQGAEWLIEEFGTADYKQDCAIMCAEALWWRCHRSMVADYLYYRGIDIMHLQPRLIGHKDCIGNRLARYDPKIIDKWQDWKMFNTGRI